MPGGVRTPAVRFVRHCGKSSGKSCRADRLRSGSVLAARWEAAPLGSDLGHPGWRSAPPPSPAFGQSFETQNRFVNALAFLPQFRKNVLKVHSPPLLLNSWACSIIASALAAYASAALCPPLWPISEHDPSRAGPFLFLKRVAARLTRSGLSNFLRNNNAGTSCPWHSSTGASCPGCTWARRWCTAPGPRTPTPVRDGRPVS